MNVTLSEHEAVCADFVARFTEAWSHPEPATLVQLLTPTARATAPMTAEAVGREQLQQTFASVMGLMPDLHVEVHDWAPGEREVYIEFTLKGTVKGRPLEWDVVDLFVLDSSLASERVTYFDTLPLLAQSLRIPRGWPGLLRARAWPRLSKSAAPRVCERPAVADAPDAAERVVASMAEQWARPTAVGTTAAPIRWGARGGTVFVELQFALSAGRDTVRWNAMRRYGLSGDRVLSERSYEDSLVRLGLLALRPRLMTGALRRALSKS